MSWSVRLLLWLLAEKRLTLAERNALSTVILERLEALPIRGIITNSDEGILINGQPVSVEKMRTLRESALAALDNSALNLVGDQVRWVATERLLHKVVVPEDLHYYRAALWGIEQLKAHLQTLAQVNQELPLSED